MAQIAIVVINEERVVLRVKKEVCWLTLNRTCNLRCYFCYARGTGYGVEKTLLLSDAKKIISFCKSASIKHLVLIGGEPTLYPDILPLLKECADGSFKVHLSTNGIRFSDEKFCDDFFAVLKPSINISIKGHDSQSYLNTTSFDAYDNLLRGFDNLRKRDVGFQVSYVLTEDNIDHFLKGVEKAFESGASALHLSFAYDFSMNAQKDKDFLIRNNPLPKIKHFIDKIDEVERVTNGNWDFENGYPLCFYSQEQIDKIGNHLATGCQMLFGDGILFDTNLNVIPCNSMYEIKMGRLGKDFSTYDEYEKFTDNSPYNEVESYLRSLPSEECMSCGKVEHCGGGCTLFWSQTSYEDARKYLTAFGSDYGLV